MKKLHQSKFDIVSDYTFVLDQTLQKKTKVMEIFRYMEFYCGDFVVVIYVFWLFDMISFLKTCVSKIAEKLLMEELTSPYFSVVLFPWFLLINFIMSQPVFTLSGNTRTVIEIGSKLTIKTLERCQWPRFGVLIVNFEQISHIVLLFPFLTLKKQMPAGLD